MNLVDAFGILLSAFMLVGFVWALLDMLLKISRQPKREGPIDWANLSSHPLVPETFKIKDPPNVRS